MASLSLIGFIARRYLLARRGFISVIAGFSLLGIMLGVATLIIVMSVMNGFRQELFSRVLGLNGHFNVYNISGGPLTNYEDMLARLRAVPGVIQTNATVEAQALLTTGGQANGVVVRGLAPADFKARPVLGQSVVQGDVQAYADDKIAIGVRLAERLGLNVGDSITLISPRGTSTAFGTAPRLRAYTIAVIFDVGMYEYDANFVFMPLAEAQNFFKLADNGVTSLEVYVQNPLQPRQYWQKIIDAAEQPVRLLDWQQANNSFVNALQVERNVMFVILTLIILVAAFNIISSLIMLVKDKTRDIAILRTMGATPATILAIFCLAGASIGITGTFLGATLGIAVADNIESIRQGLQSLLQDELFSPEIYFLSKLPAVINWLEVVQVVSIALVLSLLATIYPAWRAARLDPVEGLRHE